MNRPAYLRLTYFSAVKSEDEARSKLKKLNSLKALLEMTDRREGDPAGSLGDILTRAKSLLPHDVDSVTEEEEDDEDGNSYEDGAIESVKGDIEQTDIIEVADNTKGELIDVNRSPALATPAAAIEEEVKGDGPQAAAEEEKEGPAPSKQPFIEDLTCPGALTTVQDVEDWDEYMKLGNYTPE